MNNLERYLDQVIEQRPEMQEPPVLEVPQQEPAPNFLKSVRKRWYIVLLVALVGCGVGVPAIWYLVEPLYVVRGGVRFAAGVESVLTGEPEATGSPYNFEVNTQALLMTKGELLRSVANDLADRNLKFFSGEPQGLLGRLKAKIMPRSRAVNQEEILKNAVANGTITALPQPSTELVEVTMKGPDLVEAKQIVNTFLSNYRSMYGTQSEEGERRDLVRLENERTALLTKIDEQRRKIREDADQFGTTVLDPYQEMELQVQTLLRTQLTGLKAEIIRAQTNVEVLKQNLEKTGDANIPSEQLVAIEQEYVNADDMWRQLSTNIGEMERNLIVSRNTLQADNPVLKQQQELLEDFKAEREKRRAELIKEFNDGLADRRKAVAQQRLEQAQSELRGMLAQEAELEKSLREQGAKTIEVGRKGLDLQDSQFSLTVNMEYLDQITRRIKTLELEQSRRSRVELAYPAEYSETEDRRVKLATALVFGVLASGCGLAFLRDKMDKTLQTPDDVTRYLGLPLLGTTTSSRAIKPTLFAEQIAGDYQTIRTNLGLLSNEGIPRKLAVGSPGMKEGKTTFAVNLATSLAKSGKNVLLIDGDLRKPDVGNMLSIPNGSGGVQEVLLGEDPGRLVYAVPESGLHVLAANTRSLADVYELLASSMAAEQIERLGREYDHIIIDTPPALAFPDALVWAKLAGAVILVGFAGQTTAPDLKEAKERFKHVRVHVLGAILSNVSSEHGLYRYGYGYRTSSVSSAHRASRRKKLLLPTTQREDDDIRT